MTKITLVIPAYNEETNIAPLYEKCREVFDGSGYGFQYLFIDDGSKDGTFNEIKKISGAYSDGNVEGIRFSRNFGKESAILAGLKNADGNYVVIIDADLQHDPSYVLDMAKHLDENPDCDCVAGVMEGRKENFITTFFKRRFYHLMNNASDTEFVENASDFRMIRKNVVDAILQMEEYHRFSKGIFSWVGFNTYYMPYQVKPRLSGKTTWSFSQLVRYGVEGIIGYSTLPLKLTTWLGILTSTIAVIAFIYTFVRTLVVGRSVPGYATIVCLILLVAGVQMLLLGVMGEYLSKIYIETKKRPIYIIKDQIGTNEGNSEHDSVH